MSVPPTRTSGMAGFALGSQAKREAPASKPFLRLFGSKGLGGLAHDVRSSFVDPFLNVARDPTDPRKAVAAAASLPFGPKPLVRDQWGQLSRPEIRARPWFRGDVSKHRIEEIDPRKFEDESLYGPGLYLTDNADVALSYTEKGLDNMVSKDPVIMSTFIGNRFGYEAGMHPERWTKAMRRVARHDMIAALKAHRDKARAEGKEATFHRYTFSQGVPWHEMRTVDPGLGPNLKAFAIDPRVALSAERPLPPTVQRRLDRAIGRSKMSRGEMREFLNAVSEGRSRNVDLMYDRMRSAVGDREAVDFLRSGGVDAMQYHGGAITGSDKPHNAIVLYNMQRARPNPGVSSAPVLGERSRDAVVRYQGKLMQAERKVAPLAKRAAEQVVDLGQPLDYYYSLAKVAAKDAGIKHPRLRDAFLDTFLKGVQQRQLRAPANTNTPFG